MYAKSSETINTQFKNNTQKILHEKNMTNTPLQLQVLPPMPCTPFSPSSSIKFPNIKFTQPIANH